MPVSNHRSRIPVSRYQQSSAYSIICTVLVPDPEVLRSDSKVKAVLTRAHLQYPNVFLLLTRADSSDLFRSIVVIECHPIQGRVYF